MKNYLFASLLGDNFKINGENPWDAWFNLVQREKNNGTLWRVSDEFRNEEAVEKEGFTFLDGEGNAGTPAYKEIYLPLAWVVGNLIK